MTQNPNTLNISLLGPTNLKKFGTIVGKSQTEIERLAMVIGEATARTGATLNVVFNYSGMLELIGEAHKKAGGSLRMISVENAGNAQDWDTKPYLANLSRADVVKAFPSWHAMLLSLVSDADIVICAGLSAGVFAELAYMKWNTAEKRGRIKKLIGIKELLRTGDFPPEITADLKEFITIISATALASVLEPWKDLK